MATTPHAASSTAAPHPPPPTFLTSLSPSPDAALLPGPPLSPHSLSLLLLLRLWLTLSNPPPPDPPPSHSASLLLTRLGLALWREIHLPPSCPPSLASLHGLLSTALRPLSPSPDPQSTDLELHCLDLFSSQLDALRSPDAVDDVFAGLPPLLSPQGGGTAALSVTSPFGLFVRHQLYLYHSGGFPALTRLWDQLQSYRAGAACDYSAAQLQAVVAQRGAEVAAMAGRVSVDALDRLCEEFEGAASLSPLSPAAASTAASASLLRYLSASVSGDYEAAVNHLHRFLDYGGAASLTPASIPAKGRLLDLAALQGRFGHTALAVGLIGEAVRAAQAAQNQAQLQEALQLLTSLCASTPTPPSSLSSSLFDRAVGPLAATAAAALRAVEEWKGGGGAGPPPSLQGLEATVARTQLSVAQAELARPLSSAAPTSPPLVWAALSAASSLSSLYELQHGLAVERQLRAQAWDAFGNRHLSSLSTELHWRLSPPLCPLRRLRGVAGRTGGGRAAE